MRVFWVSLILAGLMLAGIGINYIYINDVSDELYRQLDAMPDAEAPNCIMAANALCEYWEKHVDIVGLSVSYTIVDRLSEQAATLVACAECGDFYGFRTALALTRDAVGDMRRLETFSIGNLF